MIGKWPSAPVPSGIVRKGKEPCDSVRKCRSETQDFEESVPPLRQPQVSVPRAIGDSTSISQRIEGRDVLRTMLPRSAHPYEARLGNAHGSNTEGSVGPVLLMLTHPQRTPLASD